MASVLVGVGAGVAAVVLTAAAWMLWELLVVPLRMLVFYERQGLKGPPFRPIIGNIPEIMAFRKSGRPFYDMPRDRRERWGRNSRHFLGPQFRIMMDDTMGVKEVLITHGDAFGKPGLMRRVLGPALGEGLVLSEGAVHRRHRLMVAPAFHYARLASMGPLMVDATVDAVATWSARSGAAAPPWEVDVHKELAAVTLKVILQAAFGVGGSGSGAGSSADEVYEDVSIMLKVGASASAACAAAVG
jgi:cytochrome P450